MKIYPEKEYYYPSNEKVNTILLEFKSMEQIAEKDLSEDDYEIVLKFLHDYLRTRFKLPNKIFLIQPSVDNTEARLIFFPKEPKPDDKCHDLVFMWWMKN